MIVDHLAFGARIGLIAGGIRHADVVLGHPTALTVGDEVYGCPPAFPRAIRPEPERPGRARRAVRGGARRLHRAVERRPSGRWLPTANTSEDAFAETGDVLLLNYPSELHAPPRTAALPAHAFLGSAVRRERARRRRSPSGSTAATSRSSTSAWGASSPCARTSSRGWPRPCARLDVRVALASGSTDRRRAGSGAGLVARASRAAPGDPPRPRRAGRLARRQQQRHRGPHRRGAAAPAAAVDRPVRRCRSRRGVPDSARRSTPTPPLLPRSAKPPPGCSIFRPRSEPDSTG